MKKCPFCNGRCVKRGFSNTKLKGRMQRYLCKNCKRTFTKDYLHGLGFKSNHPWQDLFLVVALKEKNKKLSSRKIAEVMGDMSHGTVCNILKKWEKHYGR